jgi:RNA polymerase sigma factor (sigma-70 family)
MPCNPDVPDGNAADSPPELRRLLDASPGPEREAAWTEFLGRHSRLMLHAARSVTRDRETAMDAYVDMIERLGERDCARLRAFMPDGRARFTTWLVLVTRRLALDWQRRRYGRVGRGGPSEAIATRRRLQDLASAVVDPAELASRAAGPDEEFLARERSAILAAALARLDPRERLILALRFDDGASAAEVARLLGFPTPFHVHRRVASLVRRLRADLRSRGLGQP